MMIDAAGPETETETEICNGNDDNNDDWRRSQLRDQFQSAA